MPIIDLERLESETHITATSSPDIDGLDMPQHVRDLIRRCMDGTEPLERPLKKPQEPDKLSPKMLQAVMMRAAGFKGKEVAHILELDEQYLSVVMWHPYSRKILASLITGQGSHVIDIKTRLEEHAAAIMERMATMALLEDDLDKVSRVGFGLLDRAGYNPKTKVEVDQRTVRVTASESTLSRLAGALEESSVVDSKVMATYVPKPPPDSDASPQDTVDDRAIALLRKVGT